MMGNLSGIEPLCLGKFLWWCSSGTLFSGLCVWTHW